MAVSSVGWRSIDDDAAVDAATRALFAFNKKRKKISNSLEDIIKKESINKLDLNLNLRPDELSLDEYLQLSSLVKNDG